MKILDGKHAPNPRRVRIFLAEKGIEIPLEQVDITKFEHMTDEFGALNPMQRIPVLIMDDGTALSESVAICRYFEELQPEPCLMGSGALGKAQVEMWNRRMEMSLMMPVAMVFRHTHPAMAELENPQLGEWADINRPRVMEAVRVLNDRLGESAHVAGDDFTIADITAIVAVDFMRPARLAIPEDHTHLLAWVEKMRARPSMTA